MEKGYKLHYYVQFMNSIQLVPHAIYEFHTLVVYLLAFERETFFIINKNIKSEMLHIVTPQEPIT